MKSALILFTITLAFASNVLSAAEPAPSLSPEERHRTSSRVLSDDQDELAADVQQLTIEQTDMEVIKLFQTVEEIMDEASERLWEHETGGETIAAETEVIEKIYEAAKKRQQNSAKEGEEEGESGSAMMGMLERMLGIEPGGKPGGNQASQMGDGEGLTGDSDKANTPAAGGDMTGKVEARKLPKGAGVAGKSLPNEFNEALKAYNRGLQQRTTQP